MTNPIKKLDKEQREAVDKMLSLAIDLVADARIDLSELLIPSPRMKCYLEARSQLGLSEKEEGEV